MDLTEKGQAILKGLSEAEAQSSFHSKTFKDILDYVDNKDELGITTRSHGIITSLVKKGYVEKGEDTPEGRKTYYLSDKGLDVIE